MIQIKRTVWWSSHHKSYKHKRCIIYSLSSKFTLSFLRGNFIERKSLLFSSEIDGSNSTIEHVRCLSSCQFQCAAWSTNKFWNIQFRNLSAVKLPKNSECLLCFKRPLYVDDGTVKDRKVPVEKFPMKNETFCWRSLSHRRRQGLGTAT